MKRTSAFSLLSVLTFFTFVVFGTASSASAEAMFMGLGSLPQHSNSRALAAGLMLKEQTNARLPLVLFYDFLSAVGGVALDDEDLYLQPLHREREHVA